jgi:ATP-dependent RNA/DNA helicase IGHMBP2
LADQRRINVAITRARRHLCVVCDSQTCKNNEFLKSFLDYCEKYGDIRSGFDYTSSANEVDGIDSIFEDVKFQKLKISDKKTVKKEIDSKKQVSTTKVKKTKISEPVFIETPEDKLFQEEVSKIIDQLKDLNNNKQTHEFPNSLNTRQRRIVHELAEKHELNHESRGENEQRYIVLSFEKKKLEKTEIKETENIVQDEQEEEEEEVVESNRSKKKRNRQKVKKVIETIESSNTSVKKEEKDSKNLKLLGEFEDQEDSDLKYRNDCTKCIYCTKFILKVNYLMHELHCSKINKKQVNNISSSACASSTSTNFNATTSKTKNDKIKKNPIENAKTDDFDELLDLFQKSNNVCNFKGCKVLVKTLGQNCEFCSNRFCLQHSLAEIHGCGDEAKKAARAHIRK